MNNVYICNIREMKIECVVPYSMQIEIIHQQNTSFTYLIALKQHFTNENVLQ